ncbi:MAG: sodium:solute symporter [Bacteroidetes bacterium]|nr:sodium:solute symporter [Bacteroidota bacterium]
MNLIDWTILFGTLIFIVGYGVWKTRGSSNIESYLLGDKSLKWWTIGLSVMATQASAITFLSTPGQAFDDGMRFIQIYFGLPIAMIIISVTFIPIYYRLKVYTAYEFLENRFDLKTRSLASLLFLVSRGLATGITIYAPSIILSTILGWNLGTTTLIIGTLVIIYTVSGGTKAVSQTQKQQMAVMMGGMVIAGIMVIFLLPKDISFGDAVNVAGKLGKMNIVNLEFDITDRYNIWSGLIGGLFLSLSYFGTDQSQVARYLSGKSVAESRLGLLFNGLLKIPMQFIILFIGVMVFVFYLFVQPPVYFNKTETNKLLDTEYKSDYINLQNTHSRLFEIKKNQTYSLVDAINRNDESAIEQLQQEIAQTDADSKKNKAEVYSLIKKVNPDAEQRDTDYVFITFIMDHLPHGLIGLLLAVIFSAAMSSTSSELNALASTTTIDIYKRSVAKNRSDKHYLNASKLLTLLWGILAILFATFASKAENLIQFVNIVGSLFYGTILGIFLSAFYIKKIEGNAVFWAAIIAESIVLSLFFFTDIAYLLYNIIGCVLVIFIGLMIQFLQKERMGTV